jgi:bifunctional DNA-binding transcriptional regulator/antitoxin component of YhaV-PrlF toxin-antitoxin module
MTATPETTEATETTETFPIFHLEVTAEQTLVLPDDLLRALGVEPGDAVAISVAGRMGFISKVEKAKLAQPVVRERIPEAKGLLRDYFPDHESVERFLAEERGG